MKLIEIQKLINAQALTACDEERDVTSGCTCDLLSWVMAHGCGDMAWVTVQTHMNVIAVAALLDFACVILPNGMKMPEDVLNKAAEEGIAVLSSSMDAFSICGLLYSHGIGGAPRK